MLTYDQINNIKTRVKALMSARDKGPSKAALNKYAANSYDFTVTPANNGVTRAEHGEKTFDLLMHLNSNNTAGVTGLTNVNDILPDITYTNIDTWLTSLESVTNNAGGANNSGCRGSSCTGYCQASCYGSSSGYDYCYGCGGGCSGCGSGCASGCNGICTNTCGNGCSVRCGNSCQYTCDNTSANQGQSGCEFSCDSGCTGGCSSSCGDSCAFICANCCRSTSDQTQGGSSGGVTCSSCSGGCSSGCGSGCSGCSVDCTGGSVATVDNTNYDWIK